METSSLDINSLLQILREKMVKDRYLTEYQAWALQHSMLEIDFKFTELTNLLHQEIIPATLDNDDQRLFKALIAYETRLWEIQSFRYIVMARNAIDKATSKLSDKLYPDED